MKHFSCDEVVGPASDVSHALRICEIRLLPSQFLRQQLLARDIDCGAAVSLKHSIFYDWNADAPDVSNLAIGTNYPVRNIAAAVLLVQLLYCDLGGIVGGSDGTRTRGRAIADLVRALATLLSERATRIY